MKYLIKTASLQNLNLLQSVQVIHLLFDTNYFTNNWWLVHYSKTTAWKRRLLRDAHKETGPFIQTLTSSSVVWSANNAHFSVKFRITLKQFFCATQATFPSWLQFLGLSTRIFETTNIHSHTSKCVRCHEAPTTKLNKKLNHLKWIASIPSVLCCTFSVKKKMCTHRWLHSNRTHQLPPKIFRIKKKKKCWLIELRVMFEEDI